MSSTDIQRKFSLVQSVHFGQHGTRSMSGLNIHRKMMLYFAMLVDTFLCLALALTGHLLSLDFLTGKRLITPMGGFYPTVSLTVMYKPSLPGKILRTGMRQNQFFIS